VTVRKATLAAVTLTCAIVLAAGGIARGSAASGHDTSVEPSRLGVLWTSGDRDVALKMVFMPSSKLLSVDEELQAGIAEMGEAGVELVACKACADSYGVSGKLEELGIEVKYMGVPLTEMLKGDWIVVTF
jgi:hypothetical protein